jgi:hypothetical protein
VRVAADGGQHKLARVAGVWQNHGMAREEEMTTRTTGRWRAAARWWMACALAGAVVAGAWWWHSFGPHRITWGSKSGGVRLGLSLSNDVIRSGDDIACWLWIKADGKGYADKGIAIHDLAVRVITENVAYCPTRVSLHDVVDREKAKGARWRQQLTIAGHAAEGASAFEDELDGHAILFGMRGNIGDTAEAVPFVEPRAVLSPGSYGLYVCAAIGPADSNKWAGVECRKRFSVVGKAGNRPVEHRADATRKAE